MDSERLRKNRIKRKIRNAKSINDLVDEIDTMMSNAYIDGLKQGAFDYLNVNLSKPKDLDEQLEEYLTFSNTKKYLLDNYTYNFNKKDKLLMQKYLVPLIDRGIVETYLSITSFENSN